MKPNDFMKGDIILGARRGWKQARHPIIFFSKSDDTFFIGAMITHSDQNSNMILFDEHFEDKGKLDDRPQFVVQQLLLKKRDWGPFVKIGKLSSAGIEYLLQHIADTKPTYWDDYIRS